MRSKPKSFYLIYDSGVRGESVDPVTGKPWYRLNWPTLKRSMAVLAEIANEPLSIVNTRTGASLTVSPEGRWS